jgi:peroxiredoxin
VDELAKLDATLVAISPELAAHSRALIEQRKLNFEILRDPGNDVAQVYGLRWVFPEDLKGLYKQFGIDLAEANGEDSWTLAVPACFIVDSAGVVQYRRVDPDYTRRPEPEETLEALRDLAK